MKSLKALKNMRMHNIFVNKINFHNIFYIPYEISISENYSENRTKITEANLRF